MKRQHFYWLLGAMFTSSFIVAACTDDGLLQPEAPAVTESATEAIPSSPLNAALGTGVCMGNDAVLAGVTSGFANDPLAFNCTANDVRIANAETASGDPIQCVPGQILTGVDIVADVVETSTSVRHDIGIWIESEDNGDGGAEDGVCDFFYFDGADITAEPGVVDGDGDQCGDMENAGTVTDFDLGDLTLVCPTDPVVQNGMTFIEVASCVSWTQPGGDRACPIPGEDPPDGARFGTLPANKSKCNCEPFLIEVEILAQLKLVKSVTTNDGGTAVADDWTLSATSTGSDASRDFSNAGGSGVFETVFTGTGYTLAESPNPGTGYSSTGQWSCDGGTLSAGNTVVSLASGEVVTCTIVNDDIAPTLKLVKTVTNDDGGSADPDDWTLSATAAAPDNGRNFSNAGGSGVFETVFANAGYTLAESGPGGYMAGSWSCDGGTQSGSNNEVITLALDDDVTCTIDNDDDGATLKLVKSVTTNDGGTAVADDWTLSATSTGSDASRDFSNAGGSGVFETVFTNTGYTLAESPNPGTGYSSTGQWSCDGGTLSAGNTVVTLSANDQVTCTIVNDDIAPTLKLVKTVTNDDGGSADPDDWTLSATAAAPDDGRNFSNAGGSGVFETVFANAGYTLAESGPGGYTAGSWSCDGGSLVGSVVTLALDDDVTCTINNDDDGATLKLVKSVTTNDGGTAVADDWTLSATSTGSDASRDFSNAGGSGVFETVFTSTGYTLAESPNPGTGYSSTGQWSCDGGTLSAGNTVVTLSANDQVTCTIVNDDIAPTLKLVKLVDNSAGGSAVPNDWTLSATAAAPDDGRNFSNAGGSGVFETVFANAGYTLAESPDPAAGYTTGSWSCDGGSLVGSVVTLGLDDDVTCTITNVAIPQECEAGDRVTSVTLMLVEPTNPNTITILVTDDNGSSPTPLASSPGMVTVGGSFTIVPDGSATFFDSQNLRFILNGELSKDLKVHLSCSDDPMVGDLHSGDANGVSATLQKTAFQTTQFN